MEDHKFRLGAYAAAIKSLAMELDTAFTNQGWESHGIPILDAIDEMSQRIRIISGNHRKCGFIHDLPCGQLVDHLEK